jgi:hypothetical protein
MRKLAPLALHDFDAQPFRVSGTAELDADPLSIFAELSDPSLWFPLMARSVWKTAATSGVGAEREIRHRLLGRAREHMLAWDSGERVAFMFKEVTSPFIDSAGEDWRLERAGIYTRVHWLFVATPSRIGRPMTPILRNMMRVLFTRACTNIQKRAGTLKAEHAKNVS